MNIEKCREAIKGLPLTTETRISLRESAKLAATHYSTYIAGNCLTQEEGGIVIIGQGTFPGRKREEAEVRNYYTALTEVEIIIWLNGSFTIIGIGPIVPWPAKLPMKNIVR
jgi:hypothetical protein